MLHTMSLKANGHGQHHISDFFYPLLMNPQADGDAFLTPPPLCTWFEDVDDRSLRIIDLARIMPVGAGAQNSL